MHNSADFVVAMVTAPDLTTARALAKKSLEARAAACANILPAIESHYWWHGKIDQSAEILIVFKTTASQSAALRDIILANHPYETPEFITLPMASGSPAYLDWIVESVARG
jgi:periplasmic divalent cation tolerance protein